MSHLVTDNQVNSAICDGLINTIYPQLRGPENYLNIRCNLLPPLLLSLAYGSGSSLAATNQVGSLQLLTEDISWGYDNLSTKPEAESFR
jgi:hypothetical protein